MKKAKILTVAILGILSSIVIITNRPIPSYACYTPPPPPPPVPCEETCIGECKGCQNNQCVEVKCDDPNNQDQCQKGHPVVLRTGDDLHTIRDLYIPGRVLPIEIVRTYRTQSDNTSIYGYGWDLNYNIKVTKSADGTKLLLNNGAGNILKYNRVSTGPNTYISPEGRSDKIIEYTDGTFERRDKHGQKSYFDSSGILQVIEDRTGNNTITFTYDEQGRIETITNDLGRDITFAYYSDRWTITDFANRTWTYSYSGDNDLHIVTDPNGQTTTYNYDSHKMTSITDANGQMWAENSYDANDKVETQRYGNSGDVFRFIYYPDTNQTKVTDRRDVNTITVYDDAGLALSETIFTFNPKLRPSDPNSYVTSYMYDKNKNMMRQNLPRGNNIRYTYDTSDNVLSRTIMPVEGSSPITIWFTYNSTFNFVHTAKDAKGNITTYDYNNVNGNLEKITYPEVDVIDTNGSFIKTSPIVTFTYNIYGQAETVTGPDGIITKYVYYDDINDVNNYGHVKNIIADYNETNGLNITSTYKYDILGNVIEVNDPNGNITKFAYNVLSKLSRITDPNNNVTDFFYDKNKQLSLIQRPIGNTNQQTSFAYDILDHVKELTDPLGYSTRFSYDKEENRSDVNDAEENNTHSDYDERGLLWKVTDANGGITTFGYTLNGDLNDINDAKGNITKYEYDGYDRLKKIVYSDDSNEQFVYDASSNVTSRTTRKGDTISYQYDSMNRLITKTRPGEPNTVFRYDIAGRLVDVNDGRTVSEGGGITKYKYDRIGRVGEVNDIFGRTVKYEYDIRGLRTKLVYPTTTSTDVNAYYLYDASGRITTINRGTSTAARYEYDELSRRTKVTYGNSASISYVYDLGNRLTRLTNNLASGTTIDFNYADYDKVGNRLSMKISDANTQVYGYDKLYQLTAVDYNDGNSADYDYDKLGNRRTVVNGETTAYTSNTINQYETVAGTNYTYDKNGNLTYDGQYTYIYDCENRMLEVKQGETTIVSYAYDYRGRRVERTAGTTTIAYLYDGDQVIAEYNASGNWQRRYYYGPGIDEPICMMRLSPAFVYYYHFDGLGSVAALSFNSAVVVEKYSYDAYGQPTIKSSTGAIRTTSAYSNPYMFTGREYDPNVGLYYYRARFYSPNLGRFLQTDPIGYLDSMNLYTYVRNNPVNWIDPWGLLVNATYTKNPGNTNNGTLTVIDSDTGRSVTVPAYSGNRPQGSGGPIPNGDYEILHHPQNRYRLDAQDSKPRNDIHEPTGRDEFRLHPPGRGHSYGCIGVETNEDWEKVKELIDKTKTETVKDKKTPPWWNPWAKEEDITKYGDLKVSEKECPKK